MTLAPDGSVWFGDASGTQLYHVDDGGTVTTVPLSGREQSNQAVFGYDVGSDHNIWLLTTGPMDGLIVRASTDGQQVTTFRLSFPLVSTWWRARMGTFG